MNNYVYKLQIINGQTYEAILNHLGSAVIFFTTALPELLGQQKKKFQIWFLICCSSVFYATGDVKSSSGIFSPITLQ